MHDVNVVVARRGRYSPPRVLAALPPSRTQDHPGAPGREGLSGRESKPRCGARDEDLFAHHGRTCYVEPPSFFWGFDPIENGPAVSEDARVDTHRETKLQEIRELVKRGDYRVDPSAVADALMRRRLGRALAREYGQLIARTEDAPRRARITHRGLATAGHIGTRALAA